MLTSFSFLIRILPIPSLKNSILSVQIIMVVWHWNMGDRMECCTSKNYELCKNRKIYENAKKAKILFFQNNKGHGWRWVSRTRCCGPHWCEQDPSGKWLVRWHLWIIPWTWSKKAMLDLIGQFGASLVVKTLVSLFGESLLGKHGGRKKFGVGWADHWGDIRGPFQSIPDWVW